MNGKVLYIDDNSSSRLLYEDILGDIFGFDYEIISVPPLRTIEEMSSYISELENLTAIVLDEIMNDSGQASFTGLELAKNLRKIYDKLPIYILTSYIDSIGDDEKIINVEYTITKEQVQNEKERKIISARIRRQLLTFNTIRDNYQQRFHELLEKSLYNELTDNELEEYKELDLFRTEVKSSGKTQEDQYTNKILNEQEDILSKIKEKLNGLN